MAKKAIEYIADPEKTKRSILILYANRCFITKYIKAVETAEIKKVKNILETGRRTRVNFLVKKIIINRIKKLVITVATAAPYKLYFGIKIRFKITFTIAPIIVIQNVFACWFKTIIAS